jgi:hypothetical protein
VNWRWLRRFKNDRDRRDLVRLIKLYLQAKSFHPLNPDYFS